MHTMAVTSPVVVVRAARVSGAVRFEERSEVGRC
jgi:carbonic anhydrase/acetyltransferase-like protein (isoleucine patch superfamily)